MAQILIIDDDRLMNQALALAVHKLGHEVSSAITLAEGMAMASVGRFDLIFLDVFMPDGDGLAMLARIKLVNSRPEVIILTGQGNSDGAEMAIRLGAWDYIGKPSTIQELTLPLLGALKYREAIARRPITTLLDRGGIIGESPAIKDALGLMNQAAGCEANVLLLGETGTGKELFAKAIHSNSRRAAGRFVVVDCASLPDHLVESILFGHRKGAFTGAESTQGGLIALADNGTLFLDEVGELPLPLQGTLLRVLQDGGFYPVGSSRQQTSSFRLISATNRDLSEMIENGSFRSDLYFRLRSMEITIPPLRERKMDVKPLLEHYLPQLCLLLECETKDFSPEVLEIFTRSKWPGNVRELIHTLEQTLAAAKYETCVALHHLPTDLRVRAARISFESQALPLPEAFGSEANASDVGQAAIDDFPDYQGYKMNCEKRYLMGLLRVTGNSRKRAQRVSQLSRTRLFELLKKHGLNVP